MAKLLSGRIVKVPSANVSAERYQFIELSETEPDLGLPSSSGQVLTSNTSGIRAWLTLNTANVVEAVNLYFTNARVVAALTAGQGISISANGLITATGEALTTANIISIVNSQLTTANVTELNNLYYTNARVLSAFLPWLTTSNVAEGSNLYYTDSRVITAVTPVLTTANVTESASNLYYTNSRVRSAISGGTGVSVDNVTGVISIGQDVSPSSNVTFGSLTVTGNLNVLGNLVQFATNTLLINDTLIQVGLGNPSDVLDIGFIGHYNDGNERHSGIIRDHQSKKYFVFDNYSPDPANDIQVANAETEIRYSTLVASTFEGNVLGTVSSLSNHTTSNLAEGSNQYFTNTRSRAAISAGSGIIYDLANGIISANIAPPATFGNANVYAALSDANVTIGNLIVRQDIVAGGNIIAINTIVANAIIIKDTPISDEFLIGSLIRANVIAANTITSNVIYANSFISTGTGVPTLSSATNLNLSANGDNGSAVVITTSPLRFKSYNQSARANIIASPGDVIYNTTVATLQYYNGNVWTNVGYDIDPLTIVTANVREWSSNLYFTNARVLAALSDANVILGNIVVRQDIVARGNITAINTIVANNLIIRDNPISDELLRGNITGGYVYTSTVFTNEITANIWNRLYTANVIETSGNLYYTDARSRSALSSGLGITYDPATGVITANIASVATYDDSNTVAAILPLLTTSNVIEGSNLYFTNTRARDALLNTDVSFANVTVLGDLFVEGNTITLNAATLTIEDKNIVLANGSPNAAAADGAGITIDGANANIIYRSTGDKFVVNKSFEISGNLTIGSGAVLSNVSGIYKLSAQDIFADSVTSNSWIGIYTSNVIETAGNLYYTNARVITAVNPRLTTANVIETGGNLYYTNARVITTVTPLLTTSNVSEGSNLYFTNTRVYAPAVEAVTPLLTTGNVVETTNQYFTNVRVSQVVDPKLTTANVNEVGNFYYTNARVVQTVTPILTTSNVSEKDNLYYTDDRALTAVNPRLTTANVIELNNLYFTNARAVIAVTPVLTTSNVAEGSNLYYTDTRSRAALSSGLGITYDTTNGIISANVQSSYSDANTVTTLLPYLTTSNVAEGSNLYYTDARVNTAVRPILTTANVTETSSNLYFTIQRAIASFIAGENILIEANGRISAANVISIYSNVILTASDLTTANVTETTQLYFTNARARAALTGGTGVSVDWATGVVSIGQDVSSTANVTFNNLNILGNLNVFGNAIQFATNTLIINDTLIQLGIGNPSDVLDIGFLGHYQDGIEKHSGIIRDHQTKKYFVFDNYETEPGNDIQVANAASNIRYSTLVASIFEGNVFGTVTSLANHTTSNLAEGTNQYFTNVRVLQVVDSKFTTANVAELDNLYYTNSRVISAVTPLLTTSNVAELDNLYYTNSRVISAVTPLLTTSNVAEGSNLYYTNARVQSYLNSLSNISIGIEAGQNNQGLDTVAIGYLAGKDDQANNSVAIGKSAGYFNLGIDAIAIGREAGASNAVQGSISIGATAGYGAGENSIAIGINSGSSSGKNSISIGESATGLINSIMIGYNNQTVNANTIVLNASSDGISTSFFRRGFYVNPIDSGYTGPDSNILLWNRSSKEVFYKDINGILENEDLRANSLTLAGQLFANGIVIRNISVSDSVLAGNVTGSTVTGNTIVTDSITANIWNGLYTANVIETAGNLYFTNARVVAALSAVQPIALAANGQITANLSYLVPINNNYTNYVNPTNVNAAIYFEFNESQVIAGSASVLSYNLNRQVVDSKNIMVIADGLVYIPQIDYTTSGNVLTLTENLGANANIEVRYFGLKTTDYVSPSLLSTVNTFVGTGNVDYVLSINPVSKNYIEVNIDGVIQISSTYSLNTKTIIFTEAPPVGANIDVRIWSGVVNASFAARTFTANGTVSQFSISSNLTAESILVFENGVAQVPAIDYTYADGVVTFVTAPAANVVIQVRELGIATPDGSANVLNAIKNKDLQTATLKPVQDAIFDLGDPTARYRNAYISGSVSSNVVIANTLIVPPVQIVPPTANTVGIAGTITWSNSHIYVCVATNTWVRSALSAWDSNVTIAPIVGESFHPFLLSLL